MAKKENKEEPKPKNNEELYDELYLGIAVSQK
jgi:hypothetical protein